MDHRLGSDVRAHLSMLLLGLFSMAVIAGCNSTSPGHATAMSTSDTTTNSEESPSSEPGSDELPTDGAPKVDNPIDTGRFQENPCLSLTSEQSQELNLGTAGRPIEAPLGNACEWRNDDTRGHAQVRFLDKDPRGLSPEYQAQKDDKWAYFIELSPIEGHPAIARGLTDDRENGGCGVVVGASDQVAFELSLQLSQENVGEKDPCEVSAEVAGMAVQTMKQG